METLLNADNWIIAGQATLKIAGNFWPVIVAMVAYAIYETLFLKGQ